MNAVKTLSIFIVSLFVLAPFLGLIGTSPAVLAQGNDGEVTDTAEGWKDLDLKWDSNNIGNPLLMNLSLNKGWNIQDATLGVSGWPVVTDKGTEWETWDYPERPRIDVGRNGDDWEFPGLLGYQNQFANESDMEEPTFSSQDTQYLYIPMPVGATLKDIKFDVNNTQSGQFEYKMYIGQGLKRVWYKSSIGFSQGPLIDTSPIAAYGVKKVCINHLDFLFDAYNDLVGVGDGGTIYIAKHDVEADQNYELQLINVGQGDPLAAVLDCDVKDYDQDISNDIAVSTADGRMYVIKNEGFGSFGVPQEIDAETSRMESVTFGDVNNDGWLDVVGGYLRGQFFVSTYDNNKGGFKTPYEVKAGTGAMNKVFVGDMDLDALNDLVGANNDRQWWYVKNNKGTGWMDEVPIRSGGSDLTSMAVVDVNWDNSPDLISGSQDGSFYVSYNLGGTFDDGSSLRGGLESMKDVVAGDLDLDGDIDILGLNADGWVYLVKNEFGFLQDGIKLIEVGKNANSISIGDLDNDNDLDLVTGTNKGFQIFWNNLGPFATTIGGGKGSSFMKEVQNYLDKYHAEDEDYDAYGNLIVDVPFRIDSTYPGSVVFENVNVTYNYEAKVDLGTGLNLYVKANHDKADSSGFIDVPVQFLTDSPGRLHIANISIGYNELFTAIIDQPMDGSEFNETQGIKFSGHSNEDPDGTSEDIEYTWMIDGRLLGTGATLNVAKGELGAGVGSHTIRFGAKKLSTKETSYTNILINIVPQSAPNLIMKINLATDKKYIEDKSVMVPVKVSNSGAVNATDIAILIKDGNRKVGSTTIDKVIVGESVTADIKWIPAAGDHKLCTSMAPAETPHKDHCVQAFVAKKEVDYTIFLIILATVFALGIVGYIAIRFKQKADIRKAEKQKKKMQAALKNQMQQEFADLYSLGGDPSAYGTDAYGGAAYGGAYDSYSPDTYGGVAGFGEVSPDYVTYKCPRCGNPTAEHGTQCFACDAKDSVKYADEAIKEVKELGIDVDEAQDLLIASKASLQSGDYEVALEEAEEAEDIANEVKDRYEKAFAMISSEAAESAAERRKKRLERRRAAREKKEKMDQMQDGSTPPQ